MTTERDFSRQPLEKGPLEKPAVSSSQSDARDERGADGLRDARLRRFFGRANQTVAAQEATRLFDQHALRRAWLAVKRAGGGAGVDGETLAAFEAELAPRLDALQAELVEGRYKPRPVKQILVPKRSGGLRPLALWAIRDRVAQRAVYDIIAPVFERTFLPCSFGFRPGLGVQDAVAALLILRDENQRWVMNADIRQCFEEIDVARLNRLVAARVQDGLLRRYIDGWLRARLFNSADGAPSFGPPEAGASQGNVLSPLLANIYLHAFDVEMTQQGGRILRYADDILVCRPRKAEAEAAVKLAEQALQKVGMALNARKTRVVHFDEGFAWLGYFFVRGRHYRIR